MKTLLNKVLILTLLSVSIFSCKKDELLNQVNPGTLPVISSSASTLALKEADKAEHAVTFKWTASDFNYDAAVQYTLQFAKQGTNFENPKNVVISANTLEKEYTVGDFNDLMALLELDFGVNSYIEVRVKASINSNVEAVYSYPKVMAVNTYEVIVAYPTWYVPGAHQADVEGVKGFYANPGEDYGWNPGTAPEIKSLADNGIYEGYINFPSATNDFKVTTDKSWSDAKGGANTGVDGNGVNTGTIGGGDNMSVLGAGYYLLTVNANDNTYTAAPRVWGIIGDATPTGWGSDTNLTYDPLDAKLKITIELTGGKYIKFRANDNWDLAFGDKTGDKILDALSGNDILVPEDGTYLVVMDLRNRGKLTYSLTKQ